MKRAFIFSVFLWLQLYTAAQQPQLVLPVGHSGGVREAIFSPDYKHILTCDRFEVPRLWDAKTGYLLANLQGHTDRVYRIGYSPDGSKFFTGSLDSTVIIWDAKKAIPLTRLTGHRGIITSGSFNRQGDLFISGADDKKARVWSLVTGKLLLEIGAAQHEGEVVAALFNKEGDKIRTIAYPGRHYWDARTGKLLAATVYKEELDKFMVTRLHVKDTSFLSEQSAEWSMTPLMPNPNRKLVYDIRSNDVQVTDTLNKKIFVTITGHTVMTRLLYFSPIGDTLYIEPDDRMFATAWDTKTMQLKKTIQYKGALRANVQRGDQNKNIILNKDRSLAVVIQDVSSNSDFTVWDTKKGNRLPQLLGNKNLPQPIQNAFFSSDNSLLLTTMYNEGEPGIIWDMSTGKLITKLPFNKEERVTHACFSSDKKLAALFGANGHISVFDIEKNKLLHTIITHSSDGIHDMIGGEISPDNTMLFFIDEMAVFKVYDLASGQEIYSLREPGNYVRSAAFMPDNKRMLLSTTGSLIRVVDITTKDTRFHFFPVDSTEYFAQVPAGYYQASPRATRLLHYVTKDLKVITFEQLDVKYNRPDKVLERIGSTDKNLVNAYRKAYFKRIRKLGIDTSFFSDGYQVPDCDFTNRDTIEYEQKGELITLHIKATDSMYQLDRFNVWVNQVPLFGQRGINIRRRATNFFDTTVSIRLSEGENRIEASVSNTNGTESYRMPLLVKYTPAVPGKSTAHFIGIGIDRFADSQYNLLYSTKDIRDLAIRLKEKYGNDILIDTLFDKDVTVTKVAALKERLLQTTVNDKVIVAYSGHGLLSRDFDYYLSTHSVNFEQPEENGLPYDALENLLDSIPARKKLMLIDACHSGELDKEDLVAVDAAPDSLVKGLKPVAYKKEEQLGLKSSFELMQSLFVNIGKSTGATIISAAAGTQFALERNDLKNGVFTFSILEAMKKHASISVSALRTIVGDRVAELTRGLQQPTSRNENNAVNWNVW